MNVPIAQGRALHVSWGALRKIGQISTTQYQVSRERMQLASKRFEVNNLFFNLDSILIGNNKAGALSSLSSTTVQKSQVTIVCQKCGNQT
jgi:hypothetical protein